MLDVKHLKTTFSVGEDTVTAVNDVSFSIASGQSVGLVGESGSGKSVTALSILRLLADNATIESGSVTLNHRDLLHTSDNDMKNIRGKDIGLIFQNPMAALNPVYTIGNQMIETLMLHFPMSKEDATAEAVSWLEKVNIADPYVRLNQYPHELSLGMCQRVMIAITLMMKPQLVIADEPTASLDVTIQAQILLLLKELQEDLGMSILMISHDLGVIAQSCDHVMVMYLGNIVESAPTTTLFKSPKHPYTKALINAIPLPNPSRKKVIEPIKGDIPSPLHIPSGCSFHPRCPIVEERCRVDLPDMKDVGKSCVRCLLA